MPNAPAEEHVKLEEDQENNIAMPAFFPSFLPQMSSMASKNGFLMHLIYLNPDAFSHYGLGL